MQGGTALFTTITGVRVRVGEKSPKIYSMYSSLGWEGIEFQAVSDRELGSLLPQRPTYSLVIVMNSSKISFRKGTFFSSFPFEACLSCSKRKEKPARMAA
jgi:hypothetical protein